MSFHTNANGRAKRPYATSADAKAQVKSMVKSGADGRRLNVYRCPVCDMFHVGRKPTTAAARAEMRAHRDRCLESHGKVES